MDLNIKYKTIKLVENKHGRKSLGYRAKQAKSS